MHAAAELLGKSGGDLGGQRRAGGEDEPQAAELFRGDFAADHRPQERGHGGENGRAPAGAVGGERLWQRTGDAEHRGALFKERHHEVAQSVRVAERDHGEIEVAGPDAHRGADLPAIGEHLGVGEGQGLRDAGAAAGELDQAEVAAAGACGSGQWMQLAAVPEGGGAQGASLLG